VQPELPLLARAVGVTKRYGDTDAVRSATVSFHAGVLHGVCGENGAGKSTLLKMVAGIVVPDTGFVEAFGTRLVPHTPREAIRRGVGMVLQHFALVPRLTVLDNMVLGAEPTSRFGWLDLERARTRIAQIADDLGVTLDLNALVETLGVGDRQRLEIARALYRDATLLILDEPTAVLTKGEATALYVTLRRLANAGKGIVVVTHKMDEVRKQADTVTVMRRGSVVNTFALTLPLRQNEKQLRHVMADITSAIMGADHTAKPLRMPTSRPRNASPEVVLEARNLRLGHALTDITFTLHSSEIVGIAGVEGNGQRELVALLAGDVPPDGGTMQHAPISVLREDRQHEGLVLDASLRDNLLLGELGAFANRRGVLNLAAIEREADIRIAQSGAPMLLDRTAETLSGGNQQKIVVARALARVKAGGARVLVAAQPTRGVDVGAVEAIHDRLRSAAAKGAAILILSTDLDELRTLCDRILVISRGRIVADLPPSTADEELGRLMLGMGTMKESA
jgi:simple sugar transport system ATP-binding protein